MKESVLVDTGALVAALDRADAAHERCRAALGATRARLITVWPVITEASYLLGPGPGQQALLELIEQGKLDLAPLAAGDAERMRQLMAKYQDLPMDLADAALVRAAERDGFRSIFTLDSDFKVYRLPGGARFELLP